jgi:hypothetical protein
MLPTLQPDHLSNPFLLTSLTLREPSQILNLHDVEIACYPCGFGFLADFYGDFRLFFFEKEFFEVGFYPVAATASLSFGFLIDAVENSWADVDADWSCSHAYL